MRLTTWVSIPFWSMVAVVISGVVGRYLYTLVPALHEPKHDLEILEHRRAITELAAGAPRTPAPTPTRSSSDEAARSERVVGHRPRPAAAVGPPRRPAADLVRGNATGARCASSRRVASRGEIARRIDRVVFFERRKELAPREQGAAQVVEAGPRPVLARPARDDAAPHRDRAGHPVSRDHGAASIASM